MTGFKSPNYTQIPNDFFDMIPDMTNAELRVVLVAMRQIFGFHKSAPEAISLSQFEKRTGLSRNGVIRGIIDATKHGVMEKSDTPGKRAVSKYTIAVNAPNEHTTSAVSELVKDSTSAATELVTSAASEHTKESVVKEKETTSTPDGVQTTAEIAEKKKEPVKQPITDVVKELETQFGIVSTGWQIAHIIQGSYKATKRKTSQTTVWVELTTRFAEEPATPEMVASFAKWYKQKTNGLSLKNTDTFLNHYAEWFKDHRQTAQKRNPVTPVAVNDDPYGIKALQNQIAKGEAA